MVNRYDVIIVGASLAGSSAAIELGKEGLKIALVDRATFPRRKPCGEGIASLGLSQLKRLGILDRVLHLPHLDFTGYNIVVGERQRFIRSPGPVGITVQRFLLDSAVLESALRFTSVHPLLSSNVERIEEDTVYLSGRVLKAPNVLLACGGNSPLLRKLGCRSIRRGAVRSGASSLYRGEFSGAVNRVTIILKRDYEFYCTPHAGGYLNVSLLTKHSAPVNIRAIFNDTSVIGEVFEKCFFAGIQVSPILGRTGLGNVRRICPVSGILLAGDAREEFDPVGGMGMSHALSSGIHAAHQILGADVRTQEEAVHIERFERTSRSMRRFTRLTQAALHGAKYFPPLLTVFASPIGKTCLKYASVDYF